MHEYSLTPNSDSYSTNLSTQISYLNPSLSSIYATSPSYIPSSTLIPGSQFPETLNLSIIPSPE